MQQREPCLSSLFLCLVQLSCLLVIKMTKQLNQAEDARTPAQGVVKMGVVENASRIVAVHVIAHVKGAATGMHGRKDRMRHI